MSGSNTLLVLGALALLSVLTLFANRAMLTSYANLLETQAMIAAIAEAENMIQEIDSKAFDEVLAEQPTSGGSMFQRGPRRTPPGWSRGKKPANFTPPGLLGKESQEKYPFFNDVDDYNGLNKLRSHPVFGPIDLRVNVWYVNPYNTALVSASAQTLAKKVELRVFTEAMQDTLKLYHVFYQ